MRAFIAIDISSEIKDALGRIESHLKYAGADVKWVDPDIIHLTLKFLGEIDDKKAEEVKAALDAAADSMEPFELGLKDIGAFPDMDNPRVIWVGLGKGSSEVSSLAAHLEEELSRIGFAKEVRPFSPHLTIGRVKSALNKAKLKDKAASAAANFDLAKVPPCRVSSVILFRSTLTPKGPVYASLHEARLTG
jgi:2'-5' RNA ligase